MRRLLSRRYPCFSDSTKRSYLGRAVEGEKLPAASFAHKSELTEIRPSDAKLRLSSERSVSHTFADAIGQYFASMGGHLSTSKDKRLAT